MNRSLAILLLLVFGTMLSMAPAERVTPTRTLILSVDNVRDAAGTIWVGIYTSEEDFLDREKARLVAVKINASGRAYVELPDMMIGKEYALGLFHDVNDNGEFDLNWLGLPAEPWAFSGTPRTRLRLPYFKEVSFLLDETASGKMVRLRKW